MHVRRCIMMLGPGLFASLALSPALATQTSAAAAAAQAPMAAVAIDPDSQQAYEQGFREGFRLGYKVGQQDADEGRKDPRKLSPYSFGTTRLQHGRYNGFITGYNAGVVTNPFKMTEELGRQAEEEEERRQSEPQEEEPEEEPAEEPAEEPVSPPEGGHDQQSEGDTNGGDSTAG
ncbi:hypothetical protein [Streptomyces sp. NPDC059909]|uniref:hypothetical protein n=1 Tax=Streptomyces sp. NPDC059909 TaxID=3346998 RepID=UPI00364E55C9